MKKFSVIDMHCDTMTGLCRSGKDFRDNDCHISLKKMTEGNYLMQCFAMFLYLEKTPEPFKQCNVFIDYFDKMMRENSDVIRPVTTVEEILENREKGLMSAMLTIEEGEAIEGSLENLQHFYDRGVRMMTLTWNFANQLAFPNYVYEGRIDTERGLTEKGIEVIKKMWEIGMIVDVAHLNDAGIYDVFKYATKPIVASHSNARAVHDVPRNLSDDMIIKMKENGGIMGINYCPDFISKDTEHNQIPDIIRHIKHIVEVGGIETVALGSDFDGIPTPVGMSDCSKTNDLYDALVREGFSEEDIDKIFYKNFLRVLKANQVTK
ncbi:MAG: membrane dipeptidase [Erysipelotrichaceae bacterium]|nr:membrane dipeptidase [Erysipelotrichaceae bacterium]